MNTKNKKLNEISKFFSYVLRHAPEHIALVLDQQGWAEIDRLIAGARTCGHTVDRQTLDEVVATNDKKRFEISADGLRIRAVQGHSTSIVNRVFVEQCPPDVLYHGTATRFLESILREGLKPGTRHHVHLSALADVALSVGKRYGKPVLLTIDARRMHEAGVKFFLAENGVWLVDAVAPEFLEQ